MSPFLSWCLFGSLIFLVFAVFWLLSGEEHDGEEAEVKSWLDDE